MLSLSVAACAFHAPTLPSSTKSSPSMNVDWKSVNQWDEAQAAIGACTEPARRAPHHENQRPW